MNSKLKITFINPPHADWCLPNMATWVFIKSFYMRSSKFSERIDWVTPPIEFNLYQNVSEICDLIEHCDLILFSSYIWNNDLCDLIAQELRKRNSNCKLVLGGPHIGLNDPDFFNSRPKYDFICQPTKPGEIFVQSLLDLYFENQGWPTNELIEWEIHSRLGRPMPLPNYSIYKEHLAYFKDLKDHADKYNLEPFVVLETTRGCPYSCTYCEWGGGTNSKIVKKDIEIVKEDIDALIAAGYRSAYSSDANFGIFPNRDIEIFKYAFERQFALTDISTMKSKNLEVRIKLIDSWFDVVAQNPKILPRTDKSVREKTNTPIDFVTSAPTVSLQSISDVAMQVANRQDLNFEDKIKLSQHIRKRSELENLPTPPIELILALPGSTIADFYKELEVIWNFKAWNSFRHDYMFLPDTELTNKEYLEKYNIELVQVYSDLIDEAGIDNKYTLYANKKTYFKTIRSCYSFKAAEFIEMFFMNSAGNYLLEKIYPQFVDHLSPAEFGKVCYCIIKKLDGFKELNDEIIDIFNPLSSPRSIKKLNGKLRTTAISEFLETYNLILLNEIYKKVLANENHRTNSRTQEAIVYRA